MNKREAQASLRLEPVRLGFHRHFRGGAFLLYGTSVHEETGDVLVHYFSVLTHARWTRLRSVFLEMVPPEDSSISALVPRFHWWRPASREELAVAAFGGPDETLRVFGNAIGLPPGSF